MSTIIEGVRSDRGSKKNRPGRFKKELNRKWKYSHFNETTGISNENTVKSVAWFKKQFGESQKRGFNVWSLGLRNTAIFQSSSKYKSGHITCTYIPHLPPTAQWPPDPLRRKAKSFTWPRSPAQSVHFRFSYFNAQLRYSLRHRHTGCLSVSLRPCFHLLPAFEHAVLCIWNIPPPLPYSLIHL